MTKQKFLLANGCERKKLDFEYDLIFKLVPSCDKCIRVFYACHRALAVSGFMKWKQHSDLTYTVSDCHCQ